MNRHTYSHLNSTKFYFCAIIFFSMAGIIPVKIVYEAFFPKSEYLEGLKLLAFVFPYVLLYKVAERENNALLKSISWLMIYGYIFAWLIVLVSTGFGIGISLFLFPIEILRGVAIRRMKLSSNLAKAWGTFVIVNAFLAIFPVIHHFGRCLEWMLAAEFFLGASRYLVDKEQEQ